MQLYTGFNVAYQGDDFAQNRVTIYRDFEQNGISFRTMYTTGIRIVHITARYESGQKYVIALSTGLIDGCLYDVINYACKELISKLNEQIY